MSGERQKIQLELAFPVEGRGEAPSAMGTGTEPLTAGRRAESPVGTEHLMEEVVEPRNVKKALRRVMANKGKPGADGMTVQQLPAYLQEQEVN